ncbi:MAG: hypothetical protein KGL10_01715 [Alphaproteobacteria bacterium]|nr:hypothetical protein [Alphaproteobacteria bacterium]MDE2336005.1 hypothetical protein [Alphaproteobacteria bacterium]
MAENGFERLSDAVLAALVLALEQKDLAVAELLSRALEMAMTRGAGGKGFVERREFTAGVEKAMNQMDALRKQSRS